MLNSLNVAQTGLAASKIGVENVSNNTSNINTEGYKKRVVDLSELGHLDSRFYGRGVMVDGTYRITSTYLNENLLTESSKENYYQTRSDILRDIETIFKETDSSGFSKDLNRYFQAMENLRATPSSEIYKADLITHANMLVENLQKMYTNIERTESLVRSDIDKSVENINEILQEIGKINDQLGREHTASNDLLDRRDLLEHKLTEYVDIQVEDIAGTYTLKIGDVTAIGNNTVIRDITAQDVREPQTDRYVQDDGRTSSILNGTTFDNDDTITYKIDNRHEVSVQFGEQLDTNGDGVNDLTVDSTNYVRALSHKINEDPEISKLVTAYNGVYTQQADGTRTTDDSKDNYLVIESNVEGNEGKFVGHILLTEQTDASDPLSVTSKSNIYRNEYRSDDAENRVDLYAFDAAITLKTGSLKAQTDLISSDSGTSNISDYKEKLDNFARVLSDITSSYVRNGNDNYEYGRKATDLYTGDQSQIREVNLFSGSSVKTLTFNEEAIKDFDQNDLDYLASLQWKKDISFMGKGQVNIGNNVSSFSDFYQEIRINVSSDKESNDFLLDTQQTVKQSIENTFDKLTKVDKDEEMLNLLKFKSAYEANAKIITTVNEMIETILGLKR